jgi:hypothetical protein
VVILDSPVGLHQGGEVSAPVFQRIAQQTLEYLHTPHDVELPSHRQVLLAERKVNDQDVDEGSPDRLGDDLDLADAAASAASTVAAAAPPAEAQAGVIPAALHEPEAEPGSHQTATNSNASRPTTPPRLPSSGMVVLDVEQGGVVVPYFLGKSVRAVVEMAEQSGLDVDAVGSGRALEQNPPAGSHAPAGSTVTVKFGR